MKPSSDLVEGSRPVGAQLLVHQALCELGVLQPREAVVGALERRAPAGEFPGQPLPTVDADLDVEREPRLDAGVHEAEVRVQEVLVEVQALARDQSEPAGGTVRRLVVLEAHAGLDRLQDADEPVVDGVLLEQEPGELFLVGRAPLQIPDRSVKLLRLGQRCFLDSGTRCLREVSKVDDPHPGIAQEDVHPAVADRPQRAAEDHAVEAGQNGRDERGVAIYKPGHGVLLGLGRLAW